MVKYKTTKTIFFFWGDMPWKWVCGRRDCGWSVDSDVFYRHGMASNQRNYLEPFPWELPFVLDFEACWLSCILSSFSPLCSSACVCVGIPFVCWLCIHIWCDPVFFFSFWFTISQWNKQPDAPDAGLMRVFQSNSPFSSSCLFFDKTQK